MLANICWILHLHHLEFDGNVADGQYFSPDPILTLIWNPLDPEDAVRFNWIMVLMARITQSGCHLFERVCKVFEDLGTVHTVWTLLATDHFARSCHLHDLVQISIRK